MSMQEVISTQGLLNKVYDEANNSLRVSGSGDTIFLPPKSFEILTGTPVISNANGIQSWEMDPTAVEAVCCQVALPMFWRQLNIGFYHGKRNATASLNVRHRVEVHDLADGNLFTEAAISNTSSTVAVPAQSVVTKRDQISNLAVAEGSLFTLTYERTATDAADTFTADSSFFGMWIKRAI